MTIAGHDPVPWLVIGTGEVSYARNEAEAVLAGFAFGTTKLTWPSNFSPPGDAHLAAAPGATSRRQWSYRIYDCVTSPPQDISVEDLLVVAALDPRAGSAAFLAMEAILPDLNSILARIDVVQTFWTLPRADLGGSPPGAGTQAWWLWRAWALLRGLEGVGPTIGDKVLHHKRPWLFPIFDDDTRRRMGGERVWQVLHDELNWHEEQFTYLERWFAAEAARRGGAYLTRLRIHDILLWGATTRNGRERELLIRAGNQVLGRSSAPGEHVLAAQPRMNKDAGFLAAKLARVHDPHVRPLNDLVEHWRREGHQVPYADPDSGGVRSKILFLHESPGPRSSPGHGSGLISADNDDPSAARFWRLSGEVGLARDDYINWNVVPWYVSATATNANATDADGQAALPYLHDFLVLLPELRVVVAMGAFAQRWWLRYLRRHPGDRALPLLAAPHTSSRARISSPDFENDIRAAMTAAGAAIA